MNDLLFPSGSKNPRYAPGPHAPEPTHLDRDTHRSLSRLVETVDGRSGRAGRWRGSKVSSGSFFILRLTRCFVFTRRYTWRRSKCASCHPSMFSSPTPRHILSVFDHDSTDLRSDSLRSDLFRSETAADQSNQRKVGLDPTKEDGTKTKFGLQPTRVVFSLTLSLRHSILSCCSLRSSKRTKQNSRRPVNKQTSLKRRVFSRILLFSFFHPSLTHKHSPLSTLLPPLLLRSSRCLNCSH